MNYRKFLELIRLNVRSIVLIGNTTWKLINIVIINPTWFRKITSFQMFLLILYGWGREVAS